MSTRSRVNEGLKRERCVINRSLQRGVRRSLQEEKVGYLFWRRIEETTEVLGDKLLQY